MEYDNVNADLFMSHAVCFEIAYDYSVYATEVGRRQWPHQKMYIDDQCRRFNMMVGAGLNVPVMPY
jgi:hypothetical protein